MVWSVATHGHGNGRAQQDDPRPKQAHPPELLLVLPRGKKRRLQRADDRMGAGAGAGLWWSGLGREEKGPAPVVAPPP